VYWTVTSVTRITSTFLSSPADDLVGEDEADAAGKLTTASTRMTSTPSGSFEWGEAQMALAGMAVAGVLLGAGLLLTLREARRIA
jgi:hypothetical protein